MPLIDKEKTVEAVATYLFINDAIRSAEPMKIRDYLVFAESILKDVPETDLVRCRDCKKKRSCVTFDGICNDDGFCSLAEARDE